MIVGPIVFSNAVKGETLTQYLPVRVFAYVVVAGTSGDHFAQLHQVPKFAY